MTRGENTGLERNVNQHIVWRQEWYEDPDVGIGFRTRVATIHRTKEDAELFLKEYQQNQIETRDYGYSKGKPYETPVSADLYAVLQATKNGLWIVNDKVWS